MTKFRMAMCGMVVAMSAGLALGQATQSSGTPTQTPTQAQPQSKTTQANNDASTSGKTDAGSTSKPAGGTDADAPAAKAQMTEKQKKLAADTDKLLAMANDLKQQVDKTNKDVLSVDVIKKAEEIEKLARSLKTEMKQ